MLEVEALPTRTSAGEWEYKAVEPSKSTMAPPSAGPGAVRRRKAGAAAGASAAGPDKSAGQREAQKPLTQLQELQVEEADAAGKRERIAAAASALLEAPEKNIAELKVCLTSGLRWYWAGRLSRYACASTGRRSCSPWLPTATPRCVNWQQPPRWLSSRTWPPGTASGHPPRRSWRWQSPRR